MKFKSLCASALVAAVLAGGLAPVALAADPSPSLAGKGSVTVTEGSLIGEEITLPDPEDPDTDLDTEDDEDIVTNPNAGKMGIIRLTNMTFKGVETGVNDITVGVAPKLHTETQEDGSKVEKVRGPIVQFGDIRSAEYGYSVSAELTKQFTLTTDETQVLNGATLTFNNAILEADASNTNKKATLDGAGQELVFDAVNDSSKKFAKADAAEKEGKGIYVMEFGQSYDYAEASKGTAGALKADGSVEEYGEGVKLFIPAATASSMINGTYEAEITWTVADLG